MTVVEFEFQNFCSQNGGAKEAMRTNQRVLVNRDTWHDVSEEVEMGVLKSFSMQRDSLCGWCAQHMASYHEFRLTARIVKECGCGGAMGTVVRNEDEIKRFFLDSFFQDIIDDQEES